DMAHDKFLEPMPTPLPTAAVASARLPDLALLEFPLLLLAAQAQGY
ncbi:MAG: hypothetical protein RLZZ126_1434, partial [Pseudomonadota bacterium]